MAACLARNGGCRTGFCAALDEAPNLPRSIVDGHIVGGDLGEAWATAQLSYEGTPLHDATESNKISIRGEFRFASPGIRIPLLSSPLGTTVEGNATGG